MAYITGPSTSLGGRSLSQRLTQLGVHMRGRIARYLAYHATRAKLSSLSDHTLHDIGLHRGLIDDLASKLASRA